jgi:hypothetical protein
MVTVVQLHPQNSAAALGSLADGLPGAERALLARALEFAEPLYAGERLSTGEPAWSHALGLAAGLAEVGMDVPGRAAGVLFAAPKYLHEPERLAREFGEEIAGLATGVEKLYQLRVATRGNPREQNEVLRKMVLGMVEDVRVVLIRLASRTQTLRWFSKNERMEKEKADYARETLDLYAPLANRLGVWQLKWELEDLSFRFLEPELYQKIASMLDERRVERQRYIARTIKTLSAELAGAGVKGDITGRPKHIYSIWTKMRAKELDFSQLYDVRAVRVIVPSVKDCYAVLGVVHNLWQPIEREFDDYISRPKGNLYQSLHTAVLGPEGKTLEVQIRTDEMHRQAEYGVAAHWRYKEPGSTAKPDRAFEQKLAWLRELPQSPTAPSSRSSPGCASCLPGATRSPTARKAPGRRALTTRCTRSRPKARWSTCRPARPRWISPTRCTRTLAIAAAARASTDASSASIRRSPAARRSKSSHPRPGDRRATGSTPSAASCAARARARRSASGSTPARSAKRPPRAVRASKRSCGARRPKAAPRTRASMRSPRGSGSPSPKSSSWRWRAMK